MAENVRKSMINIMIYHVIANNDDSFKLSVMENEKGLYMPSIEYTDEKVEFYADVTSWIFGDFFTAITNYVDRTMTPEDLHLLREEDWIDEDKARDILEILEKGIELGWDEVK